MSPQSRSLAEWIVFFGQANLPVLRHTARELARLRANMALGNSSKIADVVTPTIR